MACVINDINCYFNFYETKKYYFLKSDFKSITILYIKMNNEFRNA